MRVAIVIRFVASCCINRSSTLRISLSLSLSLAHSTEHQHHNLGDVRAEYVRTYLSAHGWRVCYGDRCWLPISCLRSLSNSASRYSSSRRRSIVRARSLVCKFLTSSRCAIDRVGVCVSAACTCQYPLTAYTYAIVDIHIDIHIDIDINSSLASSTTLASCHACDYPAARAS